MLSLTKTYEFADSRVSLRCGSALISIGSTAGEVLHKCGEPGSGYKREIVTVDGNRHYKTIITNDVEDWIYNFGAHQFQYQITLKNGIVKRIESLDSTYCTGTHNVESSIT